MNFVPQLPTMSGNGIADQRLEIGSGSHTMYTQSRCLELCVVDDNASVGPSDQGCHNVSPRRLRPPACAPHSPSSHRWFCLPALSDMTRMALQMRKGESEMQMDVIRLTLRHTHTLTTWDIDGQLAARGTSMDSYDGW